MDVHILQKMTKRKCKFCANPWEGEYCPACEGWFVTVQGLMTHLSTSSKCAWYKKGKNKETYIPLEDESMSEVNEVDEVNEGIEGGVSEACSGAR